MLLYQKSVWIVPILMLISANLLVTSVNSQGPQGDSINFSGLIDLASNFAKDVLEPSEASDQTSNQTSSRLTDFSRIIDLGINIATIAGTGGNPIAIAKQLFSLSKEDISSIVNIAKLGFGLIEPLGEIFTRLFSNPNLTKREFLAVTEVITRRLDQIQNEIEGVQNGLQNLVRGLPHMIRWEIALNTFEEYARPINNLYNRFTSYQKNRDKIANHTLINFAEAVLSHDTNSIQTLMANIHSLAAPSDSPYAGTEFDDMENSHSRVSSYMENKEGYRNSGAPSLTLRPSLFVMLAEAIKSYGICGLNQTPQQLIQGMHTLITITQAKAFAMINFAQVLLQYYKGNDFTHEHQLNSDLYMHFSRGIMKEAMVVMGDVPAYYRRCEPPKGEHKEKKTFEMITELLQGYVENDVDLNPTGTCHHYCSTYKETKVHSCLYPVEEFCSKNRKCNGKVYDCQYYYDSLKVCTSNLREKRYDWINCGSRFLGKKSTCSGTEHEIDSWTRWFVDCTYCICLCDDPSSDTTDRTFSLLPALSDIENNMVVVGVRLTKKNRVIHFQVEEGKADPQGMVDQSSRRWKDVSPLALNRRSSVEGDTIKTLSYNKRDIHLDTLVSADGHVVTGVKFNGRRRSTFIRMEMRVTPIDFTTGILKPSESYWINGKNPNVPRERIHLDDPSDPRSESKIAEDPNPTNTVIKFRSTSMEKDAAQLTVPFFDAQKVTTYPSTWLKGIEIHHRGPKQSGGFIGLEIFSYDLRKQFEMA